VQIKPLQALCMSNCVSCSSVFNK